MTVVVVVYVIVVLFLAVLTASVVLILVAYPRLKEDGVWTESDEQRLARLTSRVPGWGIGRKKIASGTEEVGDAPVSPVIPEMAAEELPVRVPSGEQDISGEPDLAGLLSGAGPADRPESSR